MADLDLTDREEFERAIAAAQTDIATSIERAGLRDDPYRYPLAALSTALGLFPHFLRHIDNAAGGRVRSEAATLTDKQFCEFSHRARCDLVEVLKLQLRPVTWKPIVHGVLGGMALAAVCFGTGSWWEASRSRSIQRWADAAYVECKKHVTTDKSGQRMCTLAMSVD